jgi:xanthine dehydrogenase accessory factor
VLAEIVQERRAAERHGAPASPSPAPERAVDPVCGMTVAAVDGSPHATVGGVRAWFCCDGCRTAYLADPDRYATAS